MVEQKAVKRFFDNTIKLYHYNDPGIVGWSSIDSQQVRFRVLSEIADLRYQHVLDAGCGTGDLFGYFQKNSSQIHYTGIDFHPGMVKLARQKYPEGRFLSDHVETHRKTYDYVLASGVFNLAGDDNINYIEEMIGKLMGMARKGIGVNMLSSKSPPSMIYPDLYYYDPLRVVDHCLETYKKIQLRHDYLPHDFTLYIYK